MSFAQSSLKLSDVANSFDYNFYLIPRSPLGSARRLFNSAAPQQLLVTPLPDWLRKGSKQASYTSLNSAYVVPVSLAPLALALPTTADTPLHLFDGLKSSAGLQVKLQAVIPLDDRLPARVVPLDGSAEATLLVRTGRFPRFSPDGNSILYRVTRAADVIVSTSRGGTVFPRRETGGLSRPVRFGEGPSPHEQSTILSL